MELKKVLESTSTGSVLEKSAKEALLLGSF